MKLSPALATIGLSTMLYQMLMLASMHTPKRMMSSIRGSSEHSIDGQRLNSPAANVDTNDDMKSTLVDFNLGKGKTVLVTGAAGFIGSHVARYCALNLHMKVVAVDDLSGGKVGNVPQLDSVSFIRGDVKDALFLEDLFDRFDIDYVYHLAASATAVGLSPFTRSNNYRNNLVGTVEILNAAVKSPHKVDCFVFTSSNAVYGEGQLQLEETVPQPDNPYGIAKYSSELDLKAAHKTWGLDNVILRLSNVYGPNQNRNDKFVNAIGNFMDRVLLGKPITIVGDGEQTEQFTYVSDVASIIAKSPLIQAARNQVVNVGSDQSHTVNEVAQKIQHIMGKDTEVQHVEAKQDVHHANVQSYSKLHRIFGKTEFVSLEGGLEVTHQAIIGERKLTGHATPQSSNEVEVVHKIPSILASQTKFEQRAKVDLQGLPENEFKHTENNCGPGTVAFMISGQLSRFIFKDNTGPLIAWNNNSTNDRSSPSWWGCGKPVIDVYIVLHRGKAVRAWVGEISTPPYVNENLTIADIKQYYQEERGARHVFVKFVDDEHMETYDADIADQISSRKLPSEYKNYVKKYMDRRFTGASRWVYLRHLTYSMALQKQRTYSIFVSQREDTLFIKPLNFTRMGFDVSKSTTLNGEPMTSNQYADSRDAHAYIFLEKWCKWYGAYADKIHIGNNAAMSTLWGQNWQDFLERMIRYSSFGYTKGHMNGSDPFQIEAFLMDLLNNATVHEIDLDRVDMRYVDGKRCVPSLYYYCQPGSTKNALSKLSISRCSDGG